MTHALEGAVILATGALSMVAGMWLQATRDARTVLGAQDEAASAKAYQANTMDRLIDTRNSLVDARAALVAEERAHAHILICPTCDGQASCADAGLLLRAAHALRLDALSYREVGR